MAGNEIYRTLVELGTVSERLKEVNQSAISFFQNNKSLATVMETLANYIGLLQSKGNSPSLIASAISLAEILNQPLKNQDVLASVIGDSLPGIERQYRDLFNSCNSTSVSDTMRVTLEQIQFSSIAHLCLSHETDMIHDAIGCFANARYELLPNVFNQAMAKEQMGAADIAFLKTGRIIPIIEPELVFPRGLKTSLRELQRVTADDLSDNADINYDVRNHKFLSSDSALSSKEMNVLCSGVEIFDSGDLFSETQLMDFISVLSRTPMTAVCCDTGKAIYDWVNELFNKKENMIGFDKKIYYHCRSREVNSMPYTFDEMKRAPYGCPSTGRFNSVGRAHFYFSDTQKGAEAEIKKHLRGDEILQTVKLKPIKEIRMLDLSNKLRRGSSFLKMMRYPLTDFSNKMPREYLLPCFVADCCQMIGFDGIKYFGSKEYSNYVSWSDGYFNDGGMCE